MVCSYHRPVSDRVISQQSFWVKPKIAVDQPLQNAIVYKQVQGEPRFLVIILEMTLPIIAPVFTLLALKREPSSSVIT